VLVGRGGAGPHDLVRMMRQGRIYGSAAESQYYAEPKRLERLGFLKARKEPGRTHARTHYELTERGLDALRDWMTTQPDHPRLGSDPILRLLAADLIGEVPVRESLLKMRDDLDDLRSRLDVADEVAETLPHRAKYLRLNHHLARRVVDAYEEWLDDVERELDSEPPAGDYGLRGSRP
jgi:DNA-binding PadR family transcriptional regulator